MFTDRVRITAQAGNGGNGCLSFRRERFLPKGGPDGGDGGTGGSVLLRATVHEQSLTPFRYQHLYRAENGRPGSGNGRHGRNGQDLVLEVPVGTIVRNEDGDVLADLNEAKAEYIAAEGGKGGRGNRHFVSSTNQSPRQTEEGEERVPVTLELELKIIADLGLVGYPNAGKSTFLSVVTNAEPDIAAYPFTTLTPQVGQVCFDDFAKFTIADIPGLIDGAHQNVGLGHDFLRHIERTRMLAFVLDMAATDPGPGEALNALLEELRLYNPELPERPSIIIANKMDEEDIANENLANLRTQTKLPIYPICAVLSENVDAVLKACREQLNALGACQAPTD